MNKNIRVHIPYGGNEEYLKGCIQSLVDQVTPYTQHKQFIVVLNDTMEPVNWDNVGNKQYCIEKHPPVQLVHAQMLTWIMKDAWENNQEIAIGIHTDAYLMQDGMKILMDTVKLAQESGKKWSHVDTGAFMLWYAFNLDFIIKENFVFDPQLFPMYFEDNHYHAISKSLGYEVIKSDPYNVACFHYGSHMIRSDPIMARKNALTFDRSKEIYRELWGGYPGDETRIPDRTAGGTRW
jgi:hypothetical protein